MVSPKTYTLKFNDQELSLTPNIWAEQSHGSCLAQFGQTSLLATVVMSDKEQDSDFFPLTVEYQERYYAAGKIFGSRFIRREGRPTDNAILTARLVDRAIRPLFPLDLKREVQVIITVLSWDEKNDPDILALIATSVALGISQIPWEGPLGVVRIAKKNGIFLVNPTYQERDGAMLDIVFAGPKLENQEIVVNMIEGEFNEAPEQDLCDAWQEAQKHLKAVIAFQEQIIQEVGQPKIARPKLEINSEIERVVKKFDQDLEMAIYESQTKKERSDLIEGIKYRIFQELSKEDSKEDLQKKVWEAVDSRYEFIFRKNILEKEKRPDKRLLDELRPISCQVGIIPRTHGSGLFTRGSTTTLSIVTLGGPGDSQLLEGMEIVGKKRFMHHYNFPPYAPGEVKPLKGPSRREIGHGLLVERALLPVIPEFEQFPYTIRVVSEVLSSNGSTSMASCCSASLALLDAGVKIKSKVAGIAIGLITGSGGQYKILTDIQGPEDHFGDMDFKAAGTRQGLTALQMDTKIPGINFEIFSQALEKAKKARLEILDLMDKTLAEPRAEISPYAPRIETLQIDPTKIGEVIGPGGKIINRIIAQTNTEIDIEPSGKIFITAKTSEDAKKAVTIIENLVKTPEVGSVFKGQVKKIFDFGAMVEIMPGKTGLVHISKLAPYKVQRVQDVVKAGDIIPVKVSEIDERGRINLELEGLFKVDKSKIGSYQTRGHRKKSRGDFYKKPKTKLS